MTKSLDVQTYDDGQIERLKKQSMTSKRTDYEKKKKKLREKKDLQCILPGRNKKWQVCQQRFKNLFLTKRLYQLMKNAIANFALNSSSNNEVLQNHLTIAEFPTVKLRNGDLSLNPKIMTTVV